MLAASPAVSTGRRSCASAAGSRSTSARGRVAARRGRLRHRDAASATLHADYVPPGEVADARLAERYPLALITPKTHLFLNSTFANQAPPALGPAGARGGSCTPTTRGARGIADGARVRVFNDRGDFRCPARVSDDARPGVLVAPMGWWNARLRGRAQRPGHHLAGAHRAGPRADLQRQPRGGRGAGQPDAARTPPWRPGCGPPPRPAAARGMRPLPHRAQHGRRRRPAGRRRDPRRQHVRPGAQRFHGGLGHGRRDLITAGSARSSVIATPVVAELAAQQVGDHLASTARRAR